MKEREIYSDLRCVPPCIIRVDGRAFKNTLLRSGCNKPFDENFAIAMANTVETFVKKSGLSPVFGYTFSDEINLLFNNVPFKGRVEKLNSIISSYLTSTFTINTQTQEPIAFDSRIISIGEKQIDEYFIWRQKEAWRNCLHSYAFYTLTSNNWKNNEAAMHLKNKKFQDLHELLFNNGINISKMPTWQKRGVLIHKKKYYIKGFNKYTHKSTNSMRKKIVQNWDIPVFSTPNGKSFIKSLMK